ncbi:hypothetical protein JB92DRAFT_2830023 [Gautieria morchelliformis]|nr:hypothetical protein JB92DRAFT_2830023 [Gautieria morchelliformis]
MLDPPPVLLLENPFAVLRDSPSAWQKFIHLRDRWMDQWMQLWWKIHRPTIPGGFSTGVWRCSFPQCLAEGQKGHGVETVGWSFNAVCGTNVVGMDGAVMRSEDEGQDAKSCYTNATQGSSVTEHSTQDTLLSCGQYELQVNSFISTPSLAMCSVNRIFLVTSTQGALTGGYDGPLLRESDGGGPWIKWLVGGFSNEERVARMGVVVRARRR